MKIAFWTLLRLVLKRRGLETDHARVISRLLVNSDLRGVRSHGTRTVNGYCKSFENGSLNPRPNVRGDRGDADVCCY